MTQEIPDNVPRRDRYDVVIAGGGWAGLCLARQLRIHQPELRCLVLESSITFRRKVGEASVELTGNYFVRRLGLSTYMYTRHLPKNGLRFFFNDPQGSAPLTEQSEVGPVALPPHPAFQIDRQRFESDLFRMNRDNGIECLMGVKVKESALAPGADDHAVHWENMDGESGEVRCRWFVDAAGRRALLGHRLDLHSEEDTLDHLACWGRFSGVRDIDSIDDDEWRARASYTARYLSTSHFAGKGYWIWFIPLSGGTVSVGIVSSRRYAEDPPLKQEEFLDFLHNHHAASELLKGAKLEDFQFFKRLAYRARQTFSSDRWATVGFASMFMDPYFSPGGDFIAWGNDFVAELIRRDHDPAVTENDFSANVELFDQVMRKRYDRLKTSQDASYASMASYNLFHTRVVYETCIYFLNQVWDFMCDDHVDPEQLRETPIMDAFEGLERMFGEQIEQTVPATMHNGLFHANNVTGDFESGADYYAPFVFSMGRRGAHAWRMEMMLKIWLFSYIKISGYRLGWTQFADRQVVQDVLSLQTVIDMHPLREEHREQLLQILSERLEERAYTEIPEWQILVDAAADDGRPRVRVKRDSFTDDRVEIELPANADERIARRVQTLWNERRPYFQLPPQLNTLRSSRLMEQVTERDEQEPA